VAREHILVVDDEVDILEVLQYNLAKNGYRVTCVTSGEEALSQARSEPPDLILLDLMLPGLDGLDVCRLLRADARTARTPIIMVTARTEEADVVTGLELGANDYVTKPFSPRVLLARIRAVLRSQTAPADGEPEAILTRHGLRLDPGRRELWIGAERVDLTSTEFAMLHFLALRPGWVYSRNQIIEAVHGGDYPVTGRSVDVQVVSLRRKLGEHGACIETVRGVGYRLRE
jgi:two-component system phosphate regulon response regulator PhoB